MSCSPQIKIHIAECFNNGMTKEELEKKYYWLKDIIAEVEKELATLKN